MGVKGVQRVYQSVGVLRVVVGGLMGAEGIKDVGKELQELQKSLNGVGRELKGFMSCK